MQEQNKQGRFGGDDVLGLLLGCDRVCGRECGR